MIDGEGLSTDELFSQAFTQLRALKNRVMGRRQRDKAMELITELFLSVENISRHVGAISFSERPVNVEDEEDDAFEERVSMSELFAGEGREDQHPQHADFEVLESGDVVALKACIVALLDENAELRKSRLDYFRVFLAYFTKGCKHEMDVTRKVLACVRRVMPKLLDRFGLSQADVGRKLGERRATTSARERRVVKIPLLEAGAKGVLGNGARGEATSAACAKAARGNRNRANAKKREPFSKTQTKRIA